MQTDTYDPFEFVGSDQDNVAVPVKKTPPPIKKAPPAIKKTPVLGKKKSPRVDPRAVISKNSDEVNEMLDIEKAIEESKKTALQEERARRCANRSLQKTTLSAASTSGLDHENATSPVHQQPAVSMGKGKTTVKKYTKSQKESTPGSTRSKNTKSNNNKKNSVKLIPVTVDIVSSSSRESSLTPTLTEPPAKIGKDSPVSGDADFILPLSDDLRSPTPTQSCSKKSTPVSSDPAPLSYAFTQTPKKNSPISSNPSSLGGHLKSQTPKKSSPFSSNSGPLSSTLAQTPSKKDSRPISSNLDSTSSVNRLKLKRKRLPSISKEPTIKLSRVDSDVVASLKKPKPDQQKSGDEKQREVAHDNNTKVNTTVTDSSHKSTEADSSISMTSYVKKGVGRKKVVSKALKTKGREAIKSSKGKGTKLSPDTPKRHLKKCPSLYAPHGTSACDYIPVIVRFFEDFKLQLQMAQSHCVTCIPWSSPVSTSRKEWLADQEDTAIEKCSTTSSPLTLTLPANPTARPQRKKEAKMRKEMVEIDSLWDWSHHNFDSDDQRLFYDSDSNNPVTSQVTNTLDQTSPHATTTTILHKHVEQLSPLNKDISIEINSSNSNSSSVIYPGRRKRKLLGRRIVGSSDFTFTGEKQSNDSIKQFSTSSTPQRAPFYHQTLSSSSPDVTGIDEDEPDEPTTTKAYGKTSVIDLTEMEEAAEVDSCESPGLSEEGQVTCPVCQQQFSETYIAIHAADCELHVDSGDDKTTRHLPATSSRLRQTTLTHTPLSTRTHRNKIFESDSDREEVTLPAKRRKARKLLTDNSKKISPVRSKESDTVNNGSVEKQSHQARPTMATTSTAAVANSVFKNVSLVEQGADDIESYSSSSGEDVPANPSSTTGASLIDYKNQFSAKSAGKVSKELLTEDNDAYLLTRKKKWMTAKKGRKEYHKRWKRFKAKGKGKK